MAAWTLEALYDDGLADNTEETAELNTDGEPCESEGSQPLWENSYGRYTGANRMVCTTVWKWASTILHEIRRNTPL